jgi:predicted DNA-binding transcriptional regulator AlpA
VLLRFRDLKVYGVRSWPTLARWIQKEGFPPGFYLAANSRAWKKADCDEWLANRPQAWPPPEIVKPAAGLATNEASNGRDRETPSVNPKATDSGAPLQALPNRSRG